MSRNTNYPDEWWNCEQVFGEYSDEVFVSYYNDEPHRGARLHQLLGSFAVIAGLETTPNMRSTTGLLAVYDHKGNLTSVWKDLDSFCKHQDHLQTAWGMTCETNHVAVILGGFINPNTHASYIEVGIG